ncbi:MAG: DNA polymerase I [Eubacterium sp.]|nr:DNA polymerase I [Eubacterium sp.]
MADRIIIIDGNSLINRAYYAMQRPMITSSGIYTQGIYGFINMLNKLLDDYAPEYISVCWDRKSPTFRHLEYKEYKAGRRKMPPELAMQLPLMKEILEAQNIANFEIDGYEADDIIGTISRLAEEKGIESLIITGDKDALQLASEQTHVLITKKGISDFDLYDRAKMLERYELSPEQFVELKGLMGDQSDNIPGIAGVGEKTGIKLLKQFGSIAEMADNLDKISNEKLREKVSENINLAFMSKKLAEINRYVPLDINFDDLKFTEADDEKLIDLYVKLEFNSFLKKLNVNLKNESAGGKALFQAKNIYEISEMEQLHMLEKFEENGTLAIKVFSDFSHMTKPYISAVALIHKDDYYFISGSDELIKKSFSALKAKNCKLIGHDLIKDIYAILYNCEYAFDVKFDTAVAEYVIDPSRSNYDLKTQVLENFHVQIESEEEFYKRTAQGDLLGDKLNKEKEFGLTVCKYILELYKIQSQKIKENKLEYVLYEIELPLVEVLASMERYGFRVDKSNLKEFGKELSQEIDRLTSAIYDDAGEVFNINSPIQLGEILFERLALPAGKKTKRGYSTSADVLEKLKDKHTIVANVLKYRMLTKLRSTYVEGLSALVASDGRIRPHFQQTVTATGRISCTEPNLQNIPIRNEYGRLLRKAFLPTAENVLIGADYSQIELRILAHLSGDSSLIEAFNNNNDVHKATASKVFDIEYDKVSSLDRSRAKAVNFGVIYGMSGFGLSEELHITRKEAENYIAEYFDKHKSVKEYMESQVEYCKNNGYTETITGRRRYIKEVNSSNFMTRKLGERLAMNSPIQGSAADIIKIAMISVYNKLKELNLKSKLILQIHDELIIDTAKGEESRVSELLTECMQNAMKLKVELLSELNIGKNWYELK